MRKIEVNKYYMHFKGNKYKVLLIAKDTETLKDVVVYQDDKGNTWVRDYSMFASKVDRDKYPDSTYTYRFTLIDN